MGRRGPGGGAVSDRDKPEGQVLRGGASNRGAVVRFGDRVRRPRSPNSATVHRLLRHLHDVGFTGAPTLRDADDDYEWLDYIDGEVAPSPPQPWCFDDAVLASVGQLLAGFHRAVSGFVLEPHDVWGHQVPSRWSGSRVCHGDVVRSNVIMRNRRAWALIDFDLCAPAQPVWEVACAARHWILLRGEGPEGPADAVRVTAHRLAVFVDAFGLSHQGRELLIDAVLDAEALQLTMLKSWVEQGNPVYVQICNDGAPARIAQRVKWVTAHRELLTTAVMS